MLPAMAFAETTQYDLFVNGEQFTSDNLTIACGEGTATYNPDAQTLTLSNASITNVPGYGGKYQASDMGRMTGADSTRRPVLKFSATGELLECYSSARQAAKQNYFSYQAIIDRCNGKCKRHVLAPDGNYYAWDNTVGVRKAKEDLRALARQEGRLFAPKNWPAT